MTAAFIIRFHYPEDDPRFAWRLAYFKAMVLPRLLAQTYSDFDIAIRCNPAHDHEFAGLAPRLRVFHVQGEAEQYREQNGARYFLDFVPWASVEDLPQYDLQMGLDSDDLIRSDYVERIMRELKEANPAGDKKVHISFQPGLFDLKTLRQYEMPQRYGPRCGSAFFALYQPYDSAVYHFAYEASHRYLYRLAEQSLCITEPGYCWATTHDRNESTRLTRSPNPTHP